MKTDQEIGVINFSDFTEEQLHKFEESHKKWVESDCWIPKQLYNERYYDVETNFPKLFNENRFIILK